MSIKKALKPKSAGIKYSVIKIIGQELSLKFKAISTLSKDGDMLLLAKDKTSFLHSVCELAGLTASPGK